MNLIRARETAGLSQQGLADKSKVPIASIKNIERGTNTNPELETTLVPLAAALGVSVYQLTGVVSRQETRRRVEAFITSGIGKPTDGEKAWLRSLDFVSILGGSEPTDETFFFFLEGRRKSEQQPSSL